MRNSFLKVLLVLIGNIISVSSYSQNKIDSLVQNNSKDTILLTDGDIIITPRSEVDTNNAIVKYINPKHLKKILKEDLDDVYSISNNKGEHILYVPDSTGDNFSVTEMHYFIIGSQDAKKRKFATLPFVSNLLLSAGAGLTGSFFAPIAPLMFTAVFSIPKIKIRPETMRDPDNINVDAYVRGYKQESYKKRKIQTLVGGGIGVLVGLATSLILRANNVPLLTKTY